MKGLVDSYLWKVVLLLWIVSSFFVLFLLGRIDGRARLVNVCPYCNHVLGKAEADEKNLDVRVGLDEKKKVTY